MSNYEPCYEPCKFCGSERILNPKTGKVFSKAKCWLNKNPNSPQKATPNPQKAINLGSNDTKRIIDAIVIVNQNLQVAIKEMRALSQMMLSGKQKEDIDTKKLDL